MTDLISCCPRPPGWRIDWPSIEKGPDWQQAMADCPQDPVHHAEGNVWVHTRMVCDALVSFPEWRALPETDQDVLFLAALLHDVGKPLCTRLDHEGRITTPGHARRGSIVARRLLWRAGLPIARREHIAALVRHHMVPFRLIDRADPRRRVLEISQTARCDYLSLLARADALGRICRDRDDLLDRVALFAEACREQGCLGGPYAFPSDHSRFLYFRTPGRDPAYHAHEDFAADVILMSGLPASGKDFWCRSRLPDWPVVSLDDLRGELDVSPAEPQGAIVNAARERARVHLRAGRTFIWNATNLSRQVRGQCINLFAEYRARVRIVYVEAGEHRLHDQNRRKAQPVPSDVIEQLLDRWEVPDCTEAHQVEWIGGG